MSEFDELVGLLNNPAVCDEAAKLIAGLAHDASHAGSMRSHEALRKALCKAAPSSAHALIALVNLSSECEEYCATLADSEGMIQVCFNVALREAGGPLEAPAVMLLANLTRTDVGASKAVAAVKASKNQLQRLSARFVAAAPPFEEELQHIGSVLCNISRVPEGREILLAGHPCILHTLLSGIPTQSPTRALAILSSVKNCAFDESSHPQILDCGEAIAICLATPLAGGGRPLSDFDKKNMPQALIDAIHGPEMTHYDVDVRKAALEAILRLTGSRFGREYFKSNRVYPVIRERHLLETDSECIELMEWFVDRTQLRDEEGEEPMALPPAIVEEMEKQKNEAEKNDSSDSAAAATEENKPSSS